MTKQDIIGLKKQFLTEIVSYEKRLFFLFFSIGLGLTVFFYNHPVLSWWKFASVYFVFLLFYEKFMFIKMYERYDKVAGEIISGKFTRFNYNEEEMCENFILYTIKKSRSGKIMNIILFIILVVLIVWMISPLIITYLIKT